MYLTKAYFDGFLKSSGPKLNNNNNNKQQRNQYYLPENVLQDKHDIFRSPLVRGSGGVPPENQFWVRPGPCTPVDLCKASTNKKSRTLPIAPSEASPGGLGAYPQENIAHAHEIAAGNAAEFGKPGELKDEAESDCTAATAVAKVSRWDAVLRLDQDGEQTMVTVDEAGEQEFLQGYRVVGYWSMDHPGQIYHQLGQGADVCGSERAERDAAQAAGLQQDADCHAQLQGIRQGCD
ncbi:hypothetical protein TRICI_002690 [Trichomonascus ciferrii]|uniref:Uncharacterized protein n=1 Tax=Trichomonascus ciferrii TaxID=44093 RepID=A0A642V6E1_9ASCO|nr:hypothetical protein TRICI_002690 [Trichomonascus ciferrii]